MSSIEEIPKPSDFKSIDAVTKEDIFPKVNELVRELNRLKERFESTLEVNSLWDGS